jgi:protein TonB
MPSFPGGQKALFDYLAENVRYPDDCEDTCVQGRVIVSFVVERDGRITEAKVVKSVYQSLDEEALRVVSGMPKWAPGKLNGEAIRTKYVIPITFKVE